MKTSKRTFITYQAVRKSLERAQFRPAGVLSTLLLETFLECEGRLLASKVVAIELCEDGKFREWRKELIDKEWLRWSEIQDDKGQYFPGRKLLPYINKEKIASKEIVTKNEVLSKNEAATKVEVQVLRDEIRQVRNSMEKVYDQLGLGPVDPPGFSKLVAHSVTVKPN